ncbi:MAG: Lrp/AsnC family transcriptional regulator [Alphaproteobacteria bacterium]|nr:Lrp/AsnC family transcriptional regulator [Alphaproteobacteria bacterium]
MELRLLDTIDLKILAALQARARLSNVELADAVGLSPSATLRRVRELEERGALSGYVALVDPSALGLGVSVMVNVTLERQVETALQVFEDRIREWPEVMECYLMTGDADYLLRVVVPDLPAYERFLMDRLTRVRGIASIKSSFALKQIVHRTALPMDHLAANKITAR